MHPKLPAQSRIALISAAVSLLLLAACQTTAVSLEEARKITTEQRGTRFVAPPRSIADVTAILDSQPLSMSAKDQDLEDRANRQPPPGAKGGKLMRFFEKRANAARRVGRQAQALEDYRTAASIARKLGEKVDGKDRQAIFRMVGLAELSRGNVATAIAAMEEAVRAWPTPLGYRGLAQVYAASGDIDAANNARDRGLSDISDFMNRRRLPPKKRMKLQTEELRLRTVTAELEGKLGNAEKFIREEIALLRQVGGDRENYSRLAGRITQLVQTLMQQSRLLEAEVVARDGLTEVLSRLGKENAITADMVRKLSQVMLAQGRFADAAKLGRSAIEIYAATGTTNAERKMAVSRRTVGIALSSEGDWDGAMAEFDHLSRGLAANQDLRDKMLSQHPAVTLAYISSGRVADILPILQSQHQWTLKRLGGKHPKTAELAVVLATAEAAAGNAPVALRLFRGNTQNYQSRSRPGGGDEEAGIADKIWRARMLEAYIGVLADTGAAGAAEEAFLLAETARGGAVQRAVAASGARAFASEPGLADLVRREQDARKQTGALYTLLADALGAPTDQQNKQAVNDLRGRIDRLRNARAAIMGEIEEKFPEYAKIINPKPPTIAEVQKQLTPGEAMISTFVGAKRSYVWAIPAKGPAAFAAVKLGREDIADSVALLRAALEPKAQTLGDIPAFDFETAHALYSGMLKPVEAGFKGAKSLLLVAHGPLGWLPLSVLTTAPYAPKGTPKVLFAGHRDAPWLARRHAVTMLPSVAALSTLRRLPPGAKGRRAFVGFGDPWFNAKQAAQGAAQAATQLAAAPSAAMTTRGMPLSLRAAPRTVGLEKADLTRLPRLPDTALEVQSIAQALGAVPETDLFLHERASEEAVKKADLSGYRVIAFATHGLIPGELDGLLQPALALSAPEVTMGAEDGLLTMGEIMGLRMDADWVVLSACNTGSGNGAGGEAVSGLGLAFFYAGTRAILVSNWPVHSTAARVLTTDLFARQAADPGLARGEALRQAMMRMVDIPGQKDADGRVQFSYAHPLFWAPFTLMGDGR